MIKRVVLVSDDAVESGGAAGVALLSARLLAERKVPVTLLNGSLEPPATPVGVEIVSLGGASLMEGGRGAAMLRGLYSGSARSFVADYIERHDTPDTVYHLHNWHKVLSPSVFQGLRSIAPRLLMTAHDYFLACPNGGQFEYPGDVVCERRPLSPGCMTTNCDRRHYSHKLWRMARHVVRMGTIDLSRTRATVIAVHEGMRPYLARGGIAPDRTVVLRNPVTPWRGDRVEAERNRSVMFVGRLERDKGVDKVAEAAERAGLPLVIIGDGPLRTELAARHPQAQLMGWRSPAEIAALVAHARILVVATRWRETFGLVTLEAVMSGVPVLISRHALIADEVAGLGCAEICNPSDADDLAARLARLGEDDRAVQRMSLAGFEKARRLAPTPERWCDDLLALYQRTLAASTGPAAARARPGAELRRF